jgi:hypothetical protein
MEEMHEQYKLDLKRMEATADAEDPTGTKKGQVLALSQNTAVAFSELNQMFNTPNEAGQYMTASQAAQQYIQDAGITDTNEAALISALAQSMYSAGAGPDTEGQLFGPGRSVEFRQKLVLTAVRTTLSALYPNYTKYMDDIEKTVDTWTAMATPFGAPEPGQGTDAGHAGETVTKSGPALGRVNQLAKAGKTKAEIEMILQSEGFSDTEVQQALYGQYS